MKNELAFKCKIAYNMRIVEKLPTSEQHLEAAKHAALGKVTDILSNPAWAHTTYLYRSKGPFSQGLITPRYIEHAKGIEVVEPSGWGWHSGEHTPWSEEFISVYLNLDKALTQNPKLRGLRYLPMFEGFGSQYSIGYDEFKDYDSGLFGFNFCVLIDKRVLALEPHQWLDRLDHPQHLQTAYDQHLRYEERVKASEGKQNSPSYRDPRRVFDPDEYNIRNRVSPRRFTGIVIGDEFGEIAYYKPKGGEDSYWKDHQSDLDIQVPPIQFLVEALDQQETRRHTLQRVDSLLEELLPIWQAKPHLAVPIYGTSGNLYWPKQLTYEDVAKIAA